ncbi:hypothetical protein Tsubulata_047413 [Turnera subulata]|uniref:Leucine-rich repeat-containing N-terminal plant-type domain-containing protein n=1 Tax=Turnera subulata TaxID=218843 RepID=A0A9Q0J733_9ROSI|nr:hypothetical protein Tsubulata_047413 [Turnera subulata]
MAAHTSFPFFFVFFLFYSSPTTFALFSTNHPPLCHDHERSALLQFKDGFIIDERWFNSCDPKVEGWKVDGGGGEASDCCLWDGVDCDDITGHVISLDLSSSCLYGTVNSSSSLFQLLHLRSLNLADNYFYESLIPSAMGLLTNLTHLNLSYSVFSGPIPSAISNLSKLSSLDLSRNIGLELIKTNSDFKTLLRKLGNLQVLHLDDVDLSSSLPDDILANSSSLVSLSLMSCNLQGEFPFSRIFQLPKLEVLLLDYNPGLTGHLPEFHTSSPLRKLSALGFLIYAHCGVSYLNWKIAGLFDFKHIAVAAVRNYVSSRQGATPPSPSFSHFWGYIYLLLLENPGLVPLVMSVISISSYYSPFKEAFRISSKLPVPLPSATLAILVSSLSRMACISTFGVDRCQDQCG